ncbi:MAG: acetylornithine deacetylase/succinyl-diaminopimelate desuccinylase-like protein [Planctomycetaceae bacterium]|jgi:acetylornithine deacetylase/succinyl-diaminopimelate desuccinylase-like protein
MINEKRLRDQVEAFWEDNIIDSLSEYIEIPNKSPSFDPDWKANGHMDRAMQHVMGWVHDQNIEHLEMELHELPGKTPTLLLEYPASKGISVEGSVNTPINDTVLIYGHLDKQPEFTGWHEGLAPWTAVRREDKLYGRGGGDDGYAIYSAVAIVKMLKDQSLPHPRIVILIEASEESGSPDLPHYMDALNTKIGTPSLVIALDSTCGNYDQLWVTTSLRGMLIGELKVQVLEQGAHSGAAGGIVGSSFRLLRQLLSRIEDEHSGAILPSFLNEQIPDIRRREAEAAGEVLSADFNAMYTYAGSSGPICDDPTELVLNNTWQATLEVTGIDGLPDLANAGNVLRPYTTAKFALRLPPTTDAKLAEKQLSELLTENAPNGVEVSFDSGEPAPGWHAPITDPALEAALQKASNTYFGAPAINMGCGGSIPFMEFLAKKLPKSQFVVTGVLGPHSNAHGPNEFLHIPTAKKITCGMASVIVEWGQR